MIALQFSPTSQRNEASIRCVEDPRRQLKCRRSICTARVRRDLCPPRAVICVGLRWPGNILLRRGCISLSARATIWRCQEDSTEVHKAPDDRFPRASLLRGGPHSFPGNWGSNTRRHPGAPSASPTVRIGKTAAGQVVNHDFSIIDEPAVHIFTYRPVGILSRRERRVNAPEYASRPA